MKPQKNYIYMYICIKVDLPPLSNNKIHDSLVSNSEQDRVDHFIFCHENQTEI